MPEQTNNNKKNKLAPLLQMFWILGLVLFFFKKLGFQSLISSHSYSFTELCLHRIQSAHTYIILHYLFLGDKYYSRLFLKQGRNTTQALPLDPARSQTVILQASRDQDYLHIRASCYHHPGGLTCTLPATPLKSATVSFC